MPGARYRGWAVMDVQHGATRAREASFQLPAIAGTNQQNGFHAPTKMAGFPTSATRATARDYPAARSSQRNNRTNRTYVCVIK